ncbi:hypothetical protein XMIN_3488 [Xanthomonas citri pv. mangiferaeindicae LMG 941]|nr:hypothetical protein Xcnt_04480 [Xanthomonas campestris pv. centellae]CCG38497.1 hypothetical protein XMIN_3488 [Xanthomonas citri pv. mangiferaeindicae LMG 941]
MIADFFLKVQQIAINSVKAALSDIATFMNHALQRLFVPINDSLKIIQIGCLPAADTCSRAAFLKTPPLVIQNYCAL